MNNVELARTLSWRELEIANTELWAKWKGKTHFSRNEKKNAPIPPKEKTPMRLLRLSFSPPAPSIRGARLSQTNELPHCGVFVLYD